MIITLAVFIIFVLHGISSSILRGEFYKYLRKRKIPHNSWDQILFSTQIRKEARIIRNKYSNNPETYEKMSYYIKWAKIDNMIFIIAMTSILIYGFLF